MREQKGMLSRRATFLWVERWARSHCPPPVSSLGRCSRCGTPPPASAHLVSLGFSKDEVQEHWGQRESAGEWQG